MKQRILLIAMIGTVGGLAGASPASAQKNPRTPADCQFSRLHLDIGQDNFLVRNGDVIKYTLDRDNVGALACKVSNISIKLQFPGPDGNPSPTLQPITNADSYPAQEPSKTFGPYAYTVNVNPGVKEIKARTSISNGVLWDGQDNPINIDKVIGATVFAPSITIDKVGSMTGPAPAPQAVTYTFYVRNGTDPALDPTATALSNVTVSDDKCGTPTYNSGDTNGNRKLEVSETWAFTCTLTHPVAGTYTNTAVANGENILNNRGVPVVSPPDTWTVVLTEPSPGTPAATPPAAAPPAVTPPATPVASVPQGAVKPATQTQAPCTMATVNKTTVRAGQLNTIRVRVRNVDAGTIVRITLPGGKVVSAKTDKNGLAILRVRPTKSGTATIRASECNEVERLSVKAARRVAAQRAPRVTG
jgi:hypothetical protein